MVDKLPSPLRRVLLLAGLAGSCGMGRAAEFKARTLVFPRDFGSHPDTRTEWWYITGYASSGATGTAGTAGAADAGARLFGFQITFFRSRVDGTQDMQSSFAAKQLLFAHAAITDVQGKKLWHDQRMARSTGASDIKAAAASEKDTAIRLRDWSLVRKGNEYNVVALGADFQLNLQFRETQPLMLQGDKGLSRKGPQPQQASFYYSKPQMAVAGSLTVKGQMMAVEASRGVAWLDHEWSNEVLPPGAVGWDWIGMNLFDGSALTAFRLRDKSGNTVWDGGSFRHPKMNPPDRPHVFSRGEVIFQASRGWKSPLTQANYPVEWLVRTPADYYIVKALVDNQELDSRGTTGAVYWEGLADLFDSNNRHVGRGYLEMTGYAKPLRM
ncbi:MAG TPA: carotenoid 1,2-hydratase [Burkholderiaceae bacterium]|nr:carotenoid 1,2-hydratase [Burkholderiaceae bacterium]